MHGGSDSDASSLVSQLESDVEMLAEEEVAAAPEADPLLPADAAVGESNSDDDELASGTRQAPGTHTVPEYSNGYFTVTNNHNYLDVLIGILPRWCKEEELGTKFLSKRVRPKDFAEEKGHPVRSYAVLRAWMLWRTQENGWKDRKVARQRWWLAEVQKLKRDLASMGALGGGTGHSSSDA